MQNNTLPVSTSQENKDKLVDRRHSFFITDNEIIENPELTGADILVYSVILYHAGKDGACWPGVPLIAKESRCGHNQVTKSLKHLQELSIIQVKKQRTTNLYTLLPVPKKNHAIPDPVEHAIPDPVEKQDPTNNTSYVRIEPTKKDTFLYENREGYTDKEIQAAVMVYDEYTKPVGNPSGFIEAVLKKTRDMETITPPEQHKPIIHHSQPQAEIDKERAETRAGMEINMDKVKQAAGIEN